MSDACQSPSRRSAIWLYAMLLSACAQPGMWQSELHTAHPLVGQVWDVRERAFTTTHQIESALVRADFVILGETHDNRDHHAIQGRLINAIAATGQHRALVMEPFDRVHQVELAASQARNPGADAEALAAAGKLAREGWKWPQHKVVIDEALAHGWPVVAGNLSRAQARAVYAGGLSAVPAFATLRDSPTFAWFEATWNDARERTLRARLEEGHCHRLPASMAPGMINAQRARDAVMAASMLEHADTGAVLIAGSGHGRLDVGAPVFLAHRRPTARVVSVALVEVEGGKSEPQDYSAIAGATGSVPAFDFVWFTPRARRKEPCEGLDMRKLKSAEKPQ